MGTDLFTDPEGAGAFRHFEAVLGHPLPPLPLDRRCLRESYLNEVWDQYGNPPEGTLKAAPGHE